MKVKFTDRIKLAVVVMVDYEAFQRELQTLFEKYDLHGVMVIPHHIMAEYLTTCRRAFETALSQLEMENEKRRMEVSGVL